MMKSTTDFDKHNGTEPTLPESLQYRLDVVFAAAAITVLAGLLIPISVQILDIAWIVSACLAAAVVVICAVAKSCHDLQGFGFLVGALALLRISLTAMTVRKILVEHIASTVIDILGKSVAGVGAIGAATLALLLAIVGFGSILPAANWIRRAAQHYADEILPVKRAALQAELSLKKIPRQQAREILEKIRAEMRFFGSMGAVAVLIRCEAAAGLAMIVVSLTLKILTDTMAGGYNAELMNILASNAAGLVIVAVVPSVTANWSCAVLSRKDSLCLKTTETSAEAGEKSQKIQLIGSTPENPKQIELLNPDFADKSRSVEQAGEKIAEFEP
jgi:flagellar biosynthesis component FlhA